MAIATQSGTGWVVPDPARLDFLPGGGTLGQVLTKRSPVDADVDWEDGGVGSGTIADGSIGSVKLAPLGTALILGRISGGTGPVEAVPMASLPVSTAVTALLGGKQDTLVSAANIKMVNGTSILGAGNIVVTGSGDALVADSLAQFAPTTSLQLKGVISDETGSGALVFATSPTFVTPALGTPASGNLANCSGLSITGGLTGLGANVGAFLATPSSANLAAAVSDETGTGVLVLATNPVLVTPNIGTPSAGVLTNCTGLPIATGVAGLAAGVAAFLATPSSANLATALTDETGAGALLFANVAVALGTGSGTLTQASHFNRHCDWTGSSAGSWALSGTASTGDYVEVTNTGTALATFTGCTAAAGYQLQALPGETFKAVYANGAWVSDSLIPPYVSNINSQSAAYTLVAADAGKTIYHPASDATPRTFTIPANATVAFPLGTIITIDNDVGSALTIAITTDTLVLVGAAGSTGSRALAAGGRAVLEKVTATRWRISGSAELT